MPHEHNKSTGEQIVHSNKMNDIISYKPNWIVRNGIMLFLCIINLMVAMTFFIEYPAIVYAKAKLVSIDPPVALKTKVAGKLTKLYVQEHDSVQQGAVIAVMESVAAPDMVVAVADEIAEMKDLLNSSEIEMAIKYFDEASLKTGWGNGLGEVQEDFYRFAAAYREFRQYLLNGFYLKKKAMLAADIIFLQRLHNNLLQQNQILKEDVSLATTTFEANESLSKDRVISAYDYRNEKSKLLNKSMSLPQLAASLIANEAAMHEKRKEVLQLENEIAQQKNAFIQSVNSFSAALSQWQSLYLIKAPVNGRVVFSDFVQENQYYNISQTLCLIDPVNSQYFAQVQIRQENFGKINIGQDVLLKLPAYPYQEFGLLKGTLSFIAAVPTDSGFIGKICFKNGLHTNQQKQLQYREGLKADVEIITSARKLSDRIFESFNALLRRN